MQHPANGKSKIVQKCALPPTSLRSVDLVVTDMAVISFADGRITLQETAPGITVAEVMAVTEADLFVPDSVPKMKILPAGPTTRSSHRTSQIAGGAPSQIWAPARVSWRV